MGEDSKEPKQTASALELLKTTKSPQLPSFNNSPQGKPPLGAQHSPPQTLLFLEGPPKAGKCSSRLTCSLTKHPTAPPAQLPDYLRGLDELMQPTWPHTWFPTMELIPIAIEGGKSQPQPTPPALPTPSPRTVVRMGQIWGGRAETWAGT